MQTIGLIVIELVALFALLFTLFFVLIIHRQKKKIEALRKLREFSFEDVESTRIFDKKAQERLASNYYSKHF